MKERRRKSLGPSSCLVHVVDHDEEGGRGRLICDFITLYSNVPLRGHAGRGERKVRKNTSTSNLQPCRGQGLVPHAVTLKKIFTARFCEEYRKDTARMMKRMTCWKSMSLARLVTARRALLRWSMQRIETIFWV
jgi:hypothetical protein